MIFPSPEIRKLAFESVGLDPLCPDSDFFEIYNKGKGEYVNRAKDWKRAQQGKDNWRRYRFHYQAGINRFHRSGKTKRDKETLLDGIKSAYTKESLGVTKIWQCLQELAALRYDVLEEANIYCIFEEQQAEYLVLAEDFLYGARWLESLWRDPSARPVGNESLLADFEPIAVLLEDTCLNEGVILEGQSVIESILPYVKTSSV